MFQNVSGPEEEQSPEWQMGSEAAAGTVYQAVVKKEKLSRALLKRVTGPTHTDSPEIMQWVVEWLCELAIEKAHKALLEDEEKNDQSLTNIAKTAIKSLEEQLNALSPLTQSLETTSLKTIYEMALIELLAQSNPTHLTTEHPSYEAAKSIQAVLKENASFERNPHLFIESVISDIKEACKKETGESLKGRHGEYTVYDLAPVEFTHQLLQKGFNDLPGASCHQLLARLIERFNGKNENTLIEDLSLALDALSAKITKESLREDYYRSSQPMSKKSDFITHAFRKGRIRTALFFINKFELDLISPNYDDTIKEMLVRDKNQVQLIELMDTRRFFSLVKLVAELEEVASKNPVAFIAAQLINVIEQAGHQEAGQRRPSLREQRQALKTWHKELSEANRNFANYLVMNIQKGKALQHFFGLDDNGPLTEHRDDQQRRLAVLLAGKPFNENKDIKLLIKLEALCAARLYEENSKYTEGKIKTIVKNFERIDFNCLQPKEMVRYQNLAKRLKINIQTEEKEKKQPKFHSFAEALAATQDEHVATVETTAEDAHHAATAAKKTVTTAESKPSDFFDFDDIFAEEDHAEAVQAEREKLKGKEQPKPFSRGDYIDVEVKAGGTLKRTRTVKRPAEESERAGENLAKKSDDTVRTSAQQMLIELTDETLALNSEQCPKNPRDKRAALEMVVEHLVALFLESYNEITASTLAEIKKIKETEDTNEKLNEHAKKTKDAFSTLMSQLKKLELSFPNDPIQKTLGSVSLYEYALLCLQYLTNPAVLENEHESHQQTAKSLIANLGKLNGKEQDPVVFLQQFALSQLKKDRKTSIEKSIEQPAMQITGLYRGVSALSFVADKTLKGFTHLTGQGLKDISGSGVVTILMTLARNHTGDEDELVNNLSAIVDEQSLSGQELREHLQSTNTQGYTFVGILHAKGFHQTALRFFEKYPGVFDHDQTFINNPPLLKSFKEETVGKSASRAEQAEMAEATATVNSEYLTIEPTNPKILAAEPLPREPVLTAATKKAFAAMQEQQARAATPSAGNAAAVRALEA